MVTPVSTPRLNLRELKMEPVRNDPKKMEIVHEVLQTVYKDTTKIMGDVERADNCTCRLVSHHDQPKGMVLTADKLEDKDTGLRQFKSLKIRTLRLIHPQEDSKKGICSRLLQYVTEKAEKQNADAMHVTVSPNERNLHDFFVRHGFSQIGVRSNKDPVLLAEIHPTAAAASLEPLLPTPIARPIRQTPTLTASSYMPMTLKPQYVKQIAEGRKTIEGRINRGTFQRTKVGDRFCFWGGAERVFCRVNDVKVFGSFREMLSQVGVGKCLPGISLEDGVRIYDSIPNYTQGAAQSGVVALHLEVEPAPPPAPEQNSYEASQYQGERRRQREEI